ncbi:MAG: patatin-like phospholipase family protein [Solirubrobacteraceae bacterium]|nr:patatin-like phospholipase family protein [Patulibacter sp.]
MGTDRRSSKPPRVAVVAAGAGARGAYEAGALSVLIPWLDARGLRPSVFVGTSAGAINAGLLAATANLPADQSAQALVNFWSGVRVEDVFRAPLRSGPGTALRYLGQIAGLPGSGVTSLLDNAPLAAFARATFEPYGPLLRENVADGTVVALALAATDGAERTTMFCDLAPGVALPQTSSGRAIDYRAAAITDRHVLASSAIPALFEPVELDGEWFTDGGVRLNVPLSPAVKFDPTHVVVVATHPATYPDAAPGPSRRPDVVDSAAAVLSSALADRMVEDLLTFDKLNRVAASAPDDDEVRRIKRLFVGPDTRHQLGELAAARFPEREGGAFDALGVIHRLLGPSEPGAGEILSYLFFDPGFATAAIDLGRDHAQRQVAAAEPWIW